jgi:hypothetical protein
MRPVHLLIGLIAAVPLHAQGFLEYPLTFDGLSYTVNIDFVNLTSLFMMGSRNYSVNLIPLFGADYVAVADDTCEDCELKGYNATQSRLDGYLENSTTNGLARESNVSFFSNGYTLYGSPVKDAVCVPQWVDKNYNSCFSKDPNKHLDFMLFNDYTPTRNSISKFPADGVMGLSSRLGSGYISFAEYLAKRKLIPYESVSIRDFQLKKGAKLAFGGYNTS